MLPPEAMYQKLASRNISTGHNCFPNIGHSSRKTTFSDRHLETLCLFLKYADSSRDQNITSLYINGKPRVSTFDFFLFERLAKKRVKDMARERCVYQKNVHIRL